MNRVQTEIAKQLKLSPAETKTVELVMQGDSNLEIAKKLFVVENTVKFNVNKVFKKVSVKSRTKLIVALANKGWYTLNQSGLPWGSL